MKNNLSSNFLGFVYCDYGFVENIVQMLLEFEFSKLFKWAADDEIFCHLVNKRPEIEAGLHAPIY
jgi:hypothetical protein